MRAFTIGFLGGAATLAVMLGGCLVDVPGTHAPGGGRNAAAGLQPEHAGAGVPGAGAVAVSGGATGSGGATAAGTSGGAAAGAAGTAMAMATGLPCEIDALLQARCRSCHGERPRAPMSLLTYTDLTAPSATDPGIQVAALAIARMQSAEAPMPPGAMPTVSDAELAAFQTWLDAGLPMGNCGGNPEANPDDPGSTDPPDPPPAAEVICTSGTHWDDEDDDENGGLDEEGPWMNPGRACIACHLDEEDEPIVQIGGTVFPTLHEEDLCYGVDGRASDAHVVITDASGATFSLPLERTGNFALLAPDEDEDDDDDDDDARPRVRFPIRAKVVANGRERAMMTPQETGDCNSCHTEQGRNGAPGRILLP
jgi:hypothetical protein